MTRKEELLAAFDEALTDERCESLTIALRNISEGESSYQDPAYFDVGGKDDYPLPGTVLWHLVHLRDCYRQYTSMIESRPGAPQEQDLAATSTLKEAVAELQHHRGELREAIIRVPEDELDDPVFEYESVAQLVRMITRHDAWHGAQIVVARRLYRTHAQ